MKIPISVSLDDPLRSQVEDIIGSVTAAWETEHNEDDTHKQITSQGNIISTNGYVAAAQQPRGRFLINFDTPTYGISPNGVAHQVVFYPANLNLGTTLLSYDNGALYGNSFLQPGSAGAPAYDRIVPPPLVNSFYLIIAEVAWVGNATGWRKVRILDQAGTVWGWVWAPAVSNTNSYRQQVSCIVPAVGPPTMPWRYYYLETFQDSGIDLDITGWLEIHKIS